MKRGTPTHPKTLALAAELGLEQWGAVGVVESIIHFAANYAKRGDIGKHTDAVIASGIGWKGDSQQLASALLAVGWLDACRCHRLRVHDWPEHADQTVSRSEEVKKRGFIECYGDASSVLAANSSDASQPSPSLALPTPTPDARSSALASHRRRAKSLAPDALDAEQWDRLDALLRENRPWLLDERSSEIAPHCNVGWVRAQVQETLAYWRSEGRPKADWVMTCANRIYDRDSSAWVYAKKEPPIADIVRARAVFSPLRPAALRGAA